jgi:hypothetical protein
VHQTLVEDNTAAARLDALVLVVEAALPRGESMRRRTLREQAVGELMLEMIERQKQGHSPDPYWRHDIIVKSRMKEIQKRRKAEKPGPPPGMLPLDITGNPKSSKK